MSAASADLTYEAIAERAVREPAFREGLEAAAVVCLAMGTDLSLPACPSDMAAVYIRRLSRGEQP